MTRIAVTVLVLVHLLATIWHGNAHTSLAINLPVVKTIFVYVVILLAPVLASVLVWTRYSLIGLWVLVISMFGALVFGIYHHYVMVSPDNVRHLPAGSPESHSQFVTSAFVIAALELVSGLYAAFCLKTRRRV